MFDNLIKVSHGSLLYYINFYILVTFYSLQCVSRLVYITKILGRLTVQLDDSSVHQTFQCRGLITRKSYDYLTIILRCDNNLR